MGGKRLFSKTKLWTPVLICLAFVWGSGKNQDDRYPEPPSRQSPTGSFRSDPAFAEDAPDVEWIKIPAGEFTMGDTFNESLERDRPAHAVYLDDYFISKYEVTFDIYDRFCDETGRARVPDAGWGRGRRPAINVCWAEAVIFCDWLSRKSGTIIHLPTEAQWEKAARGTDGRRYPWGNDGPDCGLANGQGCNGQTVPVGSYPLGVSPYGLFDVAGNVYEWCQDHFSPVYYAESPYRNPQGPPQTYGGSYFRVMRGGSCCDPTHHMRTFQRPWSVDEGSAYDNIGFRLVMEPRKTREYYVAPSGSDAQDGTLSRPWKTIQYAINRSGVGDKIWARGGVYKENIATVRRGSPGGSIVLAAYPGETPVIDGAGLAASTGVAIKHAYTRFSGFEVRNWTNGVWVAGPGGFGETAHCEFVEISDCSVHDVTTAFRADSFLQDHLFLRRCQAYGAATGFDLDGDHAEIQGCLARDSTWGFDLSGGLDVRLVNSIAAHNKTGNVRLPGGAVRLQNCTFVDAPSYNVYVLGSVQSLQMFNCILAGGDNCGLAFEKWNAGVYLGNNNIFHNDNAARAIAIGASAFYSLTQIANGAWSGFSGGDQKSLVSANPGGELFADMGNGNFRLLPGGKAVDAGSPDAAPLLDYDQRSRPAGNGVDIGAFESGASAAPKLSVSRSALYFGAVTGKWTTSQQFFIAISDESALAWTVTENASWLACSPVSGSGKGSVTVTADPAGWSALTGSDRSVLQTTIAVTSSKAENSPQIIDVTFIRMGSFAASPPFGDFATPLDLAAGITGAIPVTGWVLDDVETTKVEIWRDAVPGEAPGLWFIGDAIFVEGARPDVEQAYPGYPLNYRAGWGYMLLTNFLPAQGNGTYRIHAFAMDREGNKVLLGTKTITCDNAHAVKPFGTIDTPGQGGTASGNKYVNFGWVLTPLPGTVPKDGHLITVFVDSVLKGSLSTPPNLYNAYRSDVSNNFPGLNNTGGPGPGQGGPVGAFFLDTTGYANGVHTIFWIAYDDLGQGDGIGSRYFSIANVSGAPEADVPEAPEGEPADLPHSMAPVLVKTGFDLKAEFAPRFPDRDGFIRIEIPEVNRLEIKLGDELEAVGLEFVRPRYRGYLAVGKMLRPIPVGSSLDGRAGLFSWMPGPGFLGDYRLVFIRDEEGIRKRINVLVRIRPKQ